MRLFCYGTLMVPEVWRRVAGRPRPGRAARLPGYVRCRIAGTPWPAMVARSGAVTEGLLRSGVTVAELRRLDAWEGRLYRRVRVEVETGPGGRWPAWAYIIHPSRRRRLRCGGRTPGVIRRQS